MATYMGNLLGGGVGVDRVSLGSRLPTRRWNHWICVSRVYFSCTFGTSSSSRFFYLYSLDFIQAVSDSCKKIILDIGVYYRRNLTGFLSLKNLALPLPFPAPQCEWVTLVVLSLHGTFFFLFRVFSPMSGFPKKQTLSVCCY